MVFRVLSNRVKTRFPKMSDLIEAGLLLPSEFKIIDKLEQKYPKHQKNFMPIVWAASIVTRARDEGRIHDDLATKTLIEQLNIFREACGKLWNFNSISIPMVYLQVVTIAVYTFFLNSLMSQQYIRESSTVVKKTPKSIWFLDYVPLLIVLEFIVYMGWLKVAETMINPFGEDDDDFEINRMIDSNLIMSYLIVDEVRGTYVLVTGLLMNNFRCTTITRNS